MKIIKEIGISGIANFKKSVLPIKPGITYLYGCNELDNRNGNAAGKSVMASSVADIFYDVPMVGERQDRTKTGTRYVKYREGGSDILVASRFEGKTEKVIYKVNGESKALRTMAMTRAKVRAAWNISEEDYRTYGYLDSSTPHPLVRGSSAERKAFFVKFFQLDRLTAERKVLDKKKLELKSLRAQHTELSRTFEEVKKDMLTREQREELEARVEKIDAKIRAMQGQVAEAQRIKRLHDFRDYAGPNIKAVAKLIPDLSDFEESYKEWTSQLKKAEASEDDWAEYRDYVKAVKRYEAATEGLDLTKPLKELRQNAIEYESTRASLASARRDLEVFAELVEPKKVGKPGVEQDDLLAARAKVRHQLEHVRKFKSGLCGECGQPVKTQDPKELKERLERIEAQCEEWTRYNTYKQKRDRYLAQREAAKHLEANITKLSDTLKALKADFDLYQKRKDLHEPEVVEKPKTEYDLEALRKNKDVWKFGASHIDSIRELSTLKGDAVALDLDELSQLQEKASSLRSKLSIHNAVKSRASKMRKRLQELEAELADEPALDLVLQAYSDKAIKRMAIEEISKRLVEQINEYAPIAFEGYVFSFVWDTQVRFQVKRPGSEITDVRKLSRAESNLFTLILVWALLMFSPTHKRLSLLTLDEPAASFSERTRQKFYALLPHLLQVIPSILILTPKTDERYPDAHEYTVYRDHTGAEIRKGHPDHV